MLDPAISPVHNYRSFSGNILLVLNYRYRLRTRSWIGPRWPGAVQVSRWLAGKKIPVRSAVKQGVATFNTVMNDTPETRQEVARPRGEEKSAMSEPRTSRPPAQSPAGPAARRPAYSEHARSYERRTGAFQR